MISCRDITANSKAAVMMVMSDRNKFFVTLQTGRFTGTETVNSFQKIWIQNFARTSSIHLAHWTQAR